MGSVFALSGHQAVHQLFDISSALLEELLANPVDLFYEGIFEPVLAHSSLLQSGPAPARARKR